MKKLKDLLNESYAWERKPGKSLPTLSEVQAEYERNLQDPRWWNSDGDDKIYEPGDDVKEIKEGRGDHNILDLVSTAEDLVQNLRSNMATNSVLQREEKMGYLRAYDELLDVLSDIGYQAEMDFDR